MLAGTERPIPEGVHQLIILEFFSENCMKMKEFGPRGCVSLDPPLLNCTTLVVWL